MSFSPWGSRSIDDQLEIDDEIESYAKDNISRDDYTGETRDI